VSQRLSSAPVDAVAAPILATPVRRTAARVVRSAQRLQSVDLYRGLIMIIMLLDHTRDWVHRDGLTGDPLNLASTSPLLYFTRWITHLCAPAFVLLAGASAGFQRQRGMPIPKLSRFLWTRGLVLIFLELTLVRLFVYFDANLVFLANLQVIWVIGVAMIALAALVHLPQRAILGIGALIVCGHNLLDGIRVPVWSSPTLPEPTALARLWMLAHQGGFFPLLGYPSPVLRVHYPFLPWIGVIALGYVFADLWLLDGRRRRRALVGLSAAMILVFVALRAPNLYGDPLTWSPQDTLWKSVGSFMNVQKYPPSLLFLLITLAPCLLLLAWVGDRDFTNPLARAVVTYGRVPMFYYLLQCVWTHLCGMAVTAAHGMSLAPYFQSRGETFLGAPPPILGGNLRDVYVCWLLGAVVLYFPCRWYAAVKARRKDLVWLRYL